MPRELRYIELKDLFIRSKFIIIRFYCIESLDTIIKLDTKALFLPLLIKEKLNKHINIHEALIFTHSFTIVVVVEAISNIAYS